MPGKPSYFNRGDRPRLTEKQMFAKLAERSGKLQPESGDVPKHVPSASSSAAPTLCLEWQDRNGDSVMSQCQRYSVSAAKVMGEWRFTAWTRKPSPSPIGEATKTADEAKQLCQRHLEAQ